MKISIFGEKFNYFLVTYILIIFGIVFSFHEMKISRYVSSEENDFYMTSLQCFDNYKSVQYYGKDFCIKKNKIMLLGESMMLDLMIDFDIVFEYNMFKINKLYDIEFLAFNAVVVFLCPLAIYILCFNFTIFRPDFFNLYFSFNILYFSIFYFVPAIKNFTRIYTNDTLLIDFIFKYIFIYYFFYSFLLISFFHFVNYVLFVSEQKVKKSTPLIVKVRTKP